mgnify:CR=1 FL=1
MREKRKFLVIDTETANGLDFPLVYDFGMAVTDKTGHIYERFSYLIKDVFVLEKELMQSAYYAEKIPMYLEKIQAHEIGMIDFMRLKGLVYEVMKKHNISIVCAYNASFDRRALDNTLRYLTKSAKRFFMPYGTEWNCIQHMACQVIFTQKIYQKVAIRENWITPKGFLSTTAEVAFKYITGNYQFVEAHTALSDVEIETQIMAKCYRQHKKMLKNPYRAAWRIPQIKKGKEVA